MERIVTDLISIQLIVAFITDVSGIWNYVREWISLYISKGKSRDLPVDMPHILTCSTCQTWWLTLLYITVTGHLTLPWIAVCALLAAFVGVVGSKLNELILWLR